MGNKDRNTWKFTQIKHINDRWYILWLKSSDYLIIHRWSFRGGGISLDRLEIEQISLIFRHTFRHIANKSYVINGFDGLTFNM